MKPLGVMVESGWQWQDESSAQPPPSKSSKAIALLRSIAPGKSGSPGPMEYAKYIVAGIRNAPTVLRSRLPHPREIAKIRSIRDLRNIFRKKNNTRSFDSDFGDDSDALPPSVVTHLKWKEGKLSDGGRWWGPFRPNRKQKYAEIQKIIGGNSSSTSPLPTFATTSTTTTTHHNHNHKLCQITEASSILLAGDGKLRKPVRPEADSDDDGFESEDDVDLGDRTCLQVL